MVGFCSEDVDGVPPGNDHAHVVGDPVEVFVKVTWPLGSILEVLNVNFGSIKTTKSVEDSAFLLCEDTVILPVEAVAGTVTLSSVAVPLTIVAVVPLNFTVLLAEFESKKFPVIVTDAP